MGKREHIYEIIAENIRKERRRLGITQAELAERADDPRLICSVCLMSAMSSSM